MQQIHYMAPAKQVPQLGLDAFDYMNRTIAVDFVTLLKD